MAYLKEPYSILLAKDHDYENPDDEDIITAEGGQRTSTSDKALFSILKDIRKDISKQENLPPYVIFSGSIPRRYGHSIPGY